MHLFLVAFSLLFVWIIPAFAEDSVTVSERDCHRLIRHQPRADVAHTPGVDVRGRPVVPADLGGGSPIRLPEVITIDIGFELDEKYGLGGGGKYSGSSKIGSVTVRNGDVFYDGHRLDDADQAAVATACRDAYGKP